jgi:energy-coupling factor transporter ATP-binding protein EcfA2
MAKYLSSESIRAATQRLIDSRAKSGLVDFLVLKRALARAQANEVPFSSTDANFTGAMGDLAATYPAGIAHPAPAKFSPFVKVFGTAGADKYVTKKWLTNGPADTLSGPKWTSSVIRIEGSNPRRGSLRAGHQKHLATLLLKAGSQLPALSDAAIWYHRATDLEARLGRPADTTRLVGRMRDSFIAELGLTGDEAAALFDDKSRPLSGQSLEDVLRDAVANPQDYLPDLGRGSGGLDVMLAALEPIANDVEVGLRLSHGILLRFTAALGAKRFLILTGLAGSGKTKLAQALARWITPSSLPPDPFKPGTILKGAQSEYTVIAANSGVVELASEDGKLVPLPRVIIEEWADYIESNAVPESVGGRELRDKIEAQSKISGYLHRLESHYKPAAFALVAARRATQAAKCYEVVPVGADWTGNENVLGYPNGLDKSGYVTKPALELILHAMDHPDSPHFLLLDEMNMSHVERYFADILSIIESDEGLELYAGDMDKPETWRQTAATKRVPPRLKQLPENLFIIGTVNVDETTYMFSPKVLDRANVIEFRMDAGELEGFLENPAKPDLSKLDGKGASFGKAFVDAASNPVTVPADVKAAYDAEMLLLFKTLQGHGAEFGYRTAYEAARFIYFYKLLGNHPEEDTSWFPGAFDCVVFQKLLPKLHGSRAKLGPVLKKLWFLCAHDAAGRGADALKAAEEAARSTDKKAEPSVPIPAGAPYPLSAEKIARMWRLLIENGFASFAEA